MSAARICSLLALPLLLGLASPARATAVSDACSYGAWIEVSDALLNDTAQLELDPSFPYVHQDLLGATGAAYQIVLWAPSLHLDLSGPPETTSDGELAQGVLAGRLTVGIRVFRQGEVHEAEGSLRWWGDLGLEGGQLVASFAAVDGASVELVLDDQSPEQWFGGVLQDETQGLVAGAIFRSQLGEQIAEQQIPPTELPLDVLPGPEGSEVP